MVKKLSWTTTLGGIAIEEQIFKLAGTLSRPFSETAGVVDGTQESQEDGAGLMDLVSEQATPGSDEAASDIVLEASGALSVLWRTLQHASDGSGTPPCQAWLEILAKST